MTEDVKITTKEPAPTEPNYKKSTSLSNINETIIRKTELNTLTLGNNLSETYNKSGLSSKKRKRDINIYEYNLSVFIAWKKNIINFFSRVATIINKNLLNKSI